MTKIILAVNAGSSSVKVSVYQVESWGQTKELAETQIDGLTAPPPTLKYVRDGKTIAKGQEIERSFSSQDDAFKFLIEELINDRALTQVSQKETITHICHRVVHGGDYATPQIINEETIHNLEILTDLAPLHNGPALTIVRSCLSSLPKSKNIAFFDSQFHSTIPEHIRTYPINQEVARKNKLRKYGFHGISYAFIVRSVAAFLGKNIDDTNVIALHLGSGASACTIRAGKSCDASMGLTPLAGLPGATRSGSVDPSLVFHYASDVGALSPSSTSALHISRAEEILNKQAGWKSLTGTTDFATIAAGAAERDPVMTLAFDLVVDRICAFVGSYYVTLHGRVDALVFAGGIGERSPLLRSRVVRNCQCLGFVLEDSLNEAVARSQEIIVDVSPPGKVGGAVEDREGHKVLVCRTDEQLEMVRECAANEKLFS